MNILEEIKGSFIPIALGHAFLTVRIKGDRQVILIFKSRYYADAFIKKLSWLTEATIEITRPEAFLRSVLVTLNLDRNIYLGKIMSLDSLENSLKLFGNYEDLIDATDN